MQHAEVERALRRPFEYYYEDGLWEITAGLWIGLTLAVPMLSGGWLGHWAPVLLLLTGLFVRPAVVAAKEWWVFPRTGHVTYPSVEQEAVREPPLSLGLSPWSEPVPTSSSRDRFLRVLKPTLLSTTIAIALPLLMRGAHGVSRQLPVRIDSGSAVFHISSGLAVGGCFLYGAWRFRQRRWVVVALAVAAAGLLIPLLASSAQRALAWQASVASAALLASGLAAFVSYRRRAAVVPDSDAR
jgi:hypothetical protein